MKEDNTKEEGPLRAADWASLLQPIKVCRGCRLRNARLYFTPSRSAEGRRLRISTQALQGPLRAADWASLLHPINVRWVGAGDLKLA